MYDLIFTKPHIEAGQAYSAGDHCPEMTYPRRVVLLEQGVLDRPPDWVPGRPWPDRPWEHHTVQGQPPKVDPAPITPAAPAAQATAAPTPPKEADDGAVHQPG